MGVFKEDTDTKRVIFNIGMELANRLEQAKKEARAMGKKLDADTAVNKALDKFLKKAEKRIAEMKRKGKSPKFQDKEENEDSAEIESGTADRNRDLF